MHESIKTKLWKPVKRTLAVIFILNISMISTYAQNGTISGTILHADSALAIQGVFVQLENTEYAVSTNGNGYYILPSVPSGDYTMKVTCIGFVTVRKPVQVKANETAVVNLYLAEAQYALPEISIMTQGNTGLKRIPGSAHYISPKEIQKFSYTDINRTLRAVPGINIQEEDGFGLRPNIGLRGTGVERSSKITIMEDGVLMAPAPYADPAAYYFPTIGRMQAIEILKGSSQIKYGPYTTGGAINLISAPIPDEFSGMINLMGGSFGGRNLHARVGNAHGNIAYMLETFQFGSDGFKTIDGGGPTGFDKSDYLLKFRVSSKAGAQIAQSLTFKLGQVTETSHETYLGLTETDFANDPYRRYAASQVDLMETTQSQYALTHQVKFKRNFKLTTTVYQTRFKRNWYKLNTVNDSAGKGYSIADVLDNPVDYQDAFNTLTGFGGDDANTLTVRANNRKYYSRGIQTVLGKAFTTGPVRHEIEFGLRYHTDEADRFQWDDKYAMVEGVMYLTDAGEAGTQSNRIVSANAVAGYLQYAVKYGNTRLTPGIRYERIDLYQKDFGKDDVDRTGKDLKEQSNHVAPFMPGIGIDHAFSRFLHGFAGVHKGFSPPGPTEETRPEESINYEVGARYAKNAVSGQITLFYNNYSNLLGADLAAAGGGGTGDLFNGGKVKTRGIEFQANCDLLAKYPKSAYSLPVTLVYTYTNANFINSFSSDFSDWGVVTAGDRLPYLANNQFTAMIGLEHHKYSINVSGRYMDAMRTAPGQGEIPSNQKTDAYFVTDISANYQLHKKMSLFANVINVTNETYIVARRPAGLRPGLPRCFNLGVKARF